MVNKRDIGEGLREFALNNYETLAEFAKALDMKPQTLNSYLSGKIIPGGELLNRLSALGVDIQWLLNGSEKLSGADNADSLTFRVLGKIPAGYKEFHDMSDWPEIRSLNYDPDTHFFLVVDEEFGYSMMPLVNPGDMVLVSTTARVKNGDMVAAIFDETKGALKIYSENPKIPGAVVLSSYNQAIQPIFLRKDEVKLYKVVLVEKRS